MTMTSRSKLISLRYDGYWREVNVSGIPNESGVYSVYACSYDATNQTVSIRELVYIGESGAVRDRIRQHLSGNTGRAWKRRLRSGETLCFAYAPTRAADRQRAEAALIFKHKPPTNTEYVDNFPAEWSPTTVQTGGQSKLLSKHFTVP